MPTAAGLYYYEHGGGGRNGNTLVLLHGEGGRLEQWPYQLRRLPGWRVLAPDLPGHGRSLGNCCSSIKNYSSVIHRWLQGLGLSKVVLVGHSMGGAIALILALENPGVASSLVLLASAPKAPANPELLDRLTLPHRFRTGVELIVARSFANGCAKYLQKDFSKQLFANRSGVLREDFLVYAAFDVRTRLKFIRTPTLVLCGSEDLMVFPENSRTLYTNLPRAQLKEIKGAGHMLMLERPREVCRAIEKFLVRH